MTPHQPITDEELAALERRYVPQGDVLDGSYQWGKNYARSDVPRLIADLRAARAELAHAKRTIIQMRTDRTREQAEPEPNPTAEPNPTTNPQTP